MENRTQYSQNKWPNENEIESKEYRIPLIINSQNREENLSPNRIKSRKSIMPNYNISISNQFRKNNTKVILNPIKEKNINSKEKKGRKILRSNSPQVRQRNFNIFSEVATLSFDDQVVLLNQLANQNNFDLLKEKNKKINNGLHLSNKTRINTDYSPEEYLIGLNEIPNNYYTQENLNIQNYPNSPPTEITEITSNLPDEMKEIKETVSQMQLNIDKQEAEIQELKFQLETTKINNRENKNRELLYNNLSSLPSQSSRQYSTIAAKSKYYKSINNPFGFNLSKNLHEKYEQEVLLKPDKSLNVTEMNYSNKLSNNFGSTISEDFYTQKINSLESVLKEKESEIINTKIKLDESNKKILSISERKEKEIRKMKSLHEKDQEIINGLKLIYPGSHLQTKINLFQEQLNSLKSTNLILSKAKENLNSQIKILELKISKLTEENDALRYLNEDQKNFAHQLTKEIQLMKERAITDIKSINFQEIINKLTLDLKLAKSNEKSMENLIFELKDKGNIKISENNELKNELKVSIKQKDELISELRNEIKGKDKELEILKNETNNSRNIILQNSEELNKQLNENKILTKSNHELNSQIISYKKEIEENKKLKISGMRNNKYEKKYRELKESNALLIKTNKDLEFKLSIMIKKQNEKEEDNELLKDSLYNRSKSEILEDDANFKEEIMNLRNKITELASDNQLKASQIIKLEEASKKDKEKLMESNLKSASYLQEYNDINEELNQLKLQLKSSKKK